MRKAGPRIPCPNCGATKQWAININYNDLPSSDTIEAPEIQGFTQTVETGTKLIVQTYRCRKCSYLMLFRAEL